MGNRIVKALKNELPHINVNRVLIYCAGMTVLLVTHSREEADYLSRKRYHLERGRLYG